MNRCENNFHAPTNNSTFKKIIKYIFLHIVNYFQLINIYTKKETAKNFFTVSFSQFI